jgi:hypothetical protein
VIILNSLPVDATHDVASTEHDVSRPDEHLDDARSIAAMNSEDVMDPEEVLDPDIKDVAAADLDEITPDLAPQTKRKASASFRPIVRGAVKPLIALITAQYVIVTALTALVAMTVVQHASHVINEKFAAITMALKRF